MNKRYLLCFSLVSLLTSLVHGTGGSFGDPSGLNSGGGGSGATSPIAMVGPALIGLGVAGVGSASLENLKEMLQDIKNGKEKSTNLEEDACNVVKSAVLLTGLVYLGSNYKGDKQATEYTTRTLGTSTVLGGIFLVLKHKCGNDTLRLREYVSATAAAGFLGAFLAKYNLYWRFS